MPILLLIMNDARILYIDHNRDLNYMVHRYFTNSGFKCDTALSIDEGIKLFDSNKFAGVIFHWNIYCSQNLINKYKQKAEWLTVLSQDPAYRNKYGEFDVSLLPGGGIFIVHLHSEGFSGIRILTTGAGAVVQIAKLLEAGLIEEHVSRPYSLEHLVDKLGDHGIFPDTQQ